MQSYPDQMADWDEPFAREALARALAATCSTAQARAERRKAEELTDLVAGPGDREVLLTELGKDKRLQVIGINYKDAPDNARRFLGQYGNPYGMVGVDGNGRAAIEWGVYGVPETFIVGRDGKIAYKLVGPLTPENLERVVKPEIEKALAAS